MKTRHILLLLALPLTLAGCAQRSPVLDSQFGNAVTMLKAQQILNPEASRNTDPVSGMDGKAGVSAYGEYQKSYRAPPPPSNAFTIGITGAR